MKESRQFRAAFSELDQMMKWIREILGQFALPSKSKKFELAIEEALVNVLHYAYSTYPPGIVELEYAKQPEKLEIVIKDQGRPFNPLENPKPFDKDAALEDRDIGGLGIHFILKMSDSATYQRVDGWNILTLAQLT